MKYNVLLFPEVSVKFEGVEAETQEAAVKIAMERFSNSKGAGSDLAEQVQALRIDGVAHVELSENLEHALVDEQDDEEFQNSKWYLRQGDRWTPFFPNQP